MLSWASMPTRGLESKPSMRKGASVKGKWWSECPIGTTQGVDSMELFSCMVDDLEADDVESIAEAAARLRAELAARCTLDQYDAPDKVEAAITALNACGEEFQAAVNKVLEAYEEEDDEDEQGAVAAAAGAGDADLD